ncbi:MAG: molybdate ABC transporter substrate-binding protein [Chloroflexota bacterium]
MRTLDSASALRVLMPGAFARLGEALASAFAANVPGGRVQFHDFIPSGELAQAILSGEPADVFVSANLRYMAEVWAAGKAVNPHLLAGNRLCIIVRRDLDPPLATVEDLVRPRLRVVLPQPHTDPCGQYVTEMLDQAGLASAMRDKESRGELMYSRGSRDLPDFLRENRADAGVLYVSEAQALDESVVRFDLTPELDGHERIVFVIAPILQHGAIHSQAESFVAFMTEGPGRAMLRQAGFLDPPQLSSRQLPWEQ